MSTSISTPFNAADYDVFPVERLVDNSSTDFDLFITLQRHFILYSGNGYRWERSELTELLSAGFESFFIRKTDLSKASMYDAMVKLPIVDQQLAPPERIQNIEQIGAKFTKCLYEGELTEACVTSGKALATSLVNCIGEDRTCVQHLSGLAEHDYYTYYHSIRVAAYAVAIAISMGLKDEASLKQIALGGIFHDIGKKDVPLSLLNKSGPLTQAEWEIVRSHPTRGFNHVEDSILSHVSREIVLHHHEKRNGTGYPHALDQNSLLPEVQIATVADIFDALTSSRNYQSKRSRYEALDFMRHKLLRTEVCPDAYKGLVVCLAS